MYQVFKNGVELSSGHTGVPRQNVLSHSGHVTAVNSLTATTGRLVHTFERNLSDGSVEIVAERSARAGLRIHKNAGDRWVSSIRLERARECKRACADVESILVILNSTVPKHDRLCQARRTALKGGAQRSTVLALPRFYCA